MKIVCISDTHSVHDRMKHPLPMGDVLVHAGDFSRTGTALQIDSFARWFASQPHPHKLVICGNHEVEYSGNVKYYKKFLESYGGNVKFIHNELIEIDGIKFYGESRSPIIGNWGWGYEAGPDARDVWDEFPEEADVLVCHGPPLMYGDVCPDYRNRWTNRLVHVGCPELLERLSEAKTKWVVCGHIHYSYGPHTTPWGSTIVNAAICTESQEPDNRPLVIDTYEKTVGFEGY
jgi:Icc-related predicted phosphoesterase